MKKIILMMFLGILGTLNIQAQTGSVRRAFYMTAYKETPDTCFATLFLKDGKFTGLELTPLCYDKGVSILAELETANRPNCLKDFVSMLTYVKEKYVEWDSIAKKNGVKNFSKEIGTYKNNPALFLQATKNNNKYFQTFKIAAIHEATVMFHANDKGETDAFMGWGDIPFERTKGYNAGFWTSYPIKEKITVAQVCFGFKSASQLQSLIDALNIETAKEILLKKTNADKNIDSLFK